MKRRQFIQSGSALLGSSVTSPSFSQTPESAPERFKREFARSLENNLSLQSIAGVSKDLSAPMLRIEGQLPKALKGRFYRNGPAQFERANQRYQHWFAGDGMVQQFTFSETGVKHLGRFVRTAKFEQESKAQQFVVPAFGTHIDSKVRITGPDVMNPANINALEHGGKLLALWEGGSAYHLDPTTLNTLGTVTWKDGWAQMPFGAHPKIDAQGHLWNIGYFGNAMLTYHVNPTGQLVRSHLERLPIDPRKTGGMSHDMAVTSQYIVVPIPPVVMRWDLMAQGKSGKEIFLQNKSEPLRVWVTSKSDPSKGKLFELPHQMVFHVGNAFEDGDDVVLSFVGGQDNDFLGVTAVEMMRGQIELPGQSQLQIARLNMSTGQARVEPVSQSASEFPRIDPSKIGQNNRYLIQNASWTTHSAKKPRFGFDGLEVIDLQTGKAARYNFGQDFQAEEHILVPKPVRSSASNTELDAWAIGTAFHVPTSTTCVNVFEASNIAGGPIARAWLPYGLPLGFHGNFAS
jgi:all-trans-8'-apo-beta-carotenal 15,15'-oxygenase